MRETSKTTHSLFQNTPFWWHFRKHWLYFELVKVLGRAAKECQVASLRNMEGRFSLERKWDEMSGEKQTLQISRWIEISLLPCPFSPMTPKIAMHLNWVQIKGNVWLLTQLKPSFCLIISWWERLVLALLLFNVVRWLSSTMTFIFQDWCV